jgi:hypothetical protein
MCIVLLSPGDNTIAVNKYIIKEIPVNINMTKCFKPINNLTMQYKHVSLLSNSTAPFMYVYIYIYFFLENIHRAKILKTKISSHLPPLLLIDGTAKGKSSYKRKLARRLHIAIKLWVSCKQKLLNR